MRKSWKNVRRIYFSKEQIKNILKMTASNMDRLGRAEEETLEVHFQMALDEAGADIMGAIVSYYRGGQNEEQEIDGRFDESDSLPAPQETEWG